MSKKNIGLLCDTFTRSTEKNNGWTPSKQRFKLNLQTQSLRTQVLAFFKPQSSEASVKITYLKTLKNPFCYHFLLNQS